MLTLTSFAVAALMMTPPGAMPRQPDELPGVYLDRAGFSELMIQNSVLGGFVGLSLTQAAFGNNVRGASGLTLGIGAGVGLPLLLLRGRSISAAQAAYYNFGERWGLTNGLLLPLLWNGRDSRTYAGSLTGMFGVGLAAAVLTYPEVRLTPGQISALGSGQLFGAVTASLTMLLFDVVPASGAGFAGPVLLVSNAGAAAAYLARDSFDIDRRRVIFGDLGGYLGLAVGIGAGFLITGGSDFVGKTQTYAGCMLAGMLAGWAAGYSLSDGLDEFRDPSEASLAAALDAPVPFVKTSDTPMAQRAFGLMLRGHF